MGLPCVFIRLTGYNLRCFWCDNAYAFHEGENITIDEILRKVCGFGVKLFEITGGQPLMKDKVYPLMRELIAKWHKVMLETGGSISI